MKAILVFQPFRYSFAKSRCERIEEESDSCGVVGDIALVVQSSLNNAGLPSRVKSVPRVIIDDARHVFPHILEIRNRVESVVLQVSPNALLEGNEHIGLVEFFRQSRLPMVAPLCLVDGPHLIGCFVVRADVFKPCPVGLRLSACPRQLLVGVGLGDCTHDRFFGSESHLGSCPCYR
jgi:hypothetical protein